jgi:hypothetical protein
MIEGARFRCDGRRGRCGRGRNITKKSLRAFGSIAGAGFNTQFVLVIWSCDRDEFYSIVQIEYNTVHLYVPSMRLVYPVNLPTPPHSNSLEQH